MTAPRRRWAGRVSALAATVVALLAVPSTAPLATPPALAASATGAAVSDVTVAGGQVHLVLTAKHLPATAVVDVAHLTARVDGASVPVTGTVVGTPVRAVQRTIVLVVDTSGSMAGSGIAGARTAATAFLADVAPDVRVGLVAFAGAAQVVVPPTTDHAAVRAGIAQLTATGNTALFDGLMAAIGALGGTGQRALLLLSDGADTGSAATEAQVTTRLQAEGVALDAVAFRTSQPQTATLQRITAATKGTVTQAADVTQLASAFTTVAQRYDQRVAVTVQLPAGVTGSHAALALSLPSSAGVLSAHTSVTLPPPAVPPAAATTAAPAPPTAAATTPAAPSAGAAGLSASVAAAAVTPAQGSGSAGPRQLSHRDVVLGAVAIGLALFLFLALVLDVGRTSLGRMRMLRLVARFSLGKSAPLPEPVQHGNAVRDAAITRVAVRLAGRVVERRDPQQKLRLLLDRAAIPLLPSEWLLVLAGSAVLLTVVVSLVIGNPFAGLLLGAPIGVVGAHSVARWRARRRTDAFLAALPDALLVSAGSLSTGYSLSQALDSIVRQGRDPIAGEIGRALAQTRLGVPVEDALLEVAERMRSKDFAWVVMAIRINREVGGSLSEVLSTVATTLREREQLRRHVRGLSAEGRLSGYILVSLPIVLTGFLFLFRRAYIRPLYTEPLGIAMLVAAATLIVVGALWMRSLVKVES